MELLRIKRGNDNIFKCLDPWAAGSAWLHTQPWWRHQMETFSALLALCVGNPPVPLNFPHKGQWCGALKFSLIWAWIKDGVNNREVGDLRRHRGHYDVNIMNIVPTNTIPSSRFCLYFWYQCSRGSKQWITISVLWQLQLDDGFMAIIW